MREVKIKDALKKRKLFLIWLSSYLLILLVSVAISFGIYFRSIRIIEQEISRANLSMIDQARQAMDSRMRDIERLAMQIALNPRILDAIRVYGQLRPEDHFNLYKAIEDLRHYGVSSVFVTDVYVYIHETDTVITPTTHMTGKLFFNTTIRGLQISFEEWMSIMRASHRRNYLVFEEEDSATNNRNLIVNAQSIPIESIRNPRGTIVISINESKFRDIVEDIGWADQGAVFIIDGKEEIVAASDKNKASKFLEGFNNQIFYELSRDNGIIHHIVDGKKTVVTYSSSNIADWRYISIIPYSVFWEKAGYIRYLAWVAVVLTFFIGGAGSYILTKKNYSPIDKIIKNITGNSKIKFSAASNEYQFIQENISNMLDENEKISKKLEDQNRTLKDNFLLKLLKGKLDDSTSALQAYSIFGKNDHTNYFAVMLFNIEGLPNWSDDSKMLNSITIKHANFIVARSLEELINIRNNSIIFEEEEGMIACIVNFKEADTPENHSYMLKIASEAREFINDNFKIIYTTTTSNTHQGLIGISQAYKEALEAMEYRIVAGSGGIISYKDIKQSKCADYHYSIETEKKMINCIKTGDFEKTTSVLMQVFQDNFSKEAFSHEMAKCLMFDLVSTIMKTAEDLSDVSFIEELQPVKRLSECKTVMEMKFRLAEILKKICEYIEVNKTSKNDQLSCKVKDFIVNNYSEVNLGVSMIGDKFGLTPSYVSKLFKEQTKESLPDYINKVRIEMAMHLLRDKHATIFDVAQKVGYCNSNVFIRVFKKYQGITPGRFKEMKESSYIL